MLKLSSNALGQWVVLVSCVTGVLGGLVYTLLLKEGLSEARCNPSHQLSCGIQIIPLSPQSVAIAGAVFVILAGGVVVLFLWGQSRWSARR